MKHRPLYALILFLVSSIAASGQDIHWIWSGPAAKANQTVGFRRLFEVPADVGKAEWMSTADNSHKVWLNGQLIHQQQEWEKAGTVDVSSKLKLGFSNVITVEAVNVDGPGGFAGALNMTMKSGRTAKLLTDKNWSASESLAEGWMKPEFNAKAWPAAAVVAAMGEAPWGMVMNYKAEKNAKAPAAPSATYNVAPGFLLEKIYDVPTSQGSWVAITPAHDGAFYCADQYGEIYRVKADGKNPTQVELAGVKMTGAHGLLWHKEALYVVVNESVGGEPGVYKVDWNQGSWGVPKLLKSAPGRSEHGPHSLVASPDGTWIYFIAGNHTNPIKFDKSMPATTWQEDQLVPRKPDPRGHAVTRMAPGGYIARFRPDGSNWEMVAIGFRNAFDIAFNLEGDLFAYDADMEWDFGTPWYRPTRINHVVSGSEFGWRNGSGKWPAYYEDSHGSVVDIGPGCPTGLLSGKGAKFPEKYQRALFALDWTFATLYAIHLRDDGSGYTGEVEEIVAGAGLPLTDAVISHDGTMVFLTGGRKTQSAMWRLSYTGKESTASVAPKTMSRPALDRRQLEEWTTDTTAAKIETVWESLASPDRSMRYSARLALEKQPVAAWIAKLQTEKNPWRLIHGCLALCRLNSIPQKKEVWSTLEKCDWSALNEPQRLNWLRATGLAIIRLGEPSDKERQMILQKIDSQFPAKDAALNRELCLLLSRIQAPGIVARTLNLMDQTTAAKAPDWAELASRNARYGASVKNMLQNYPPVENTWYAYCLRVVRGPWQPGQRERYLGWIGTATTRSGGESYIGYLQGIRDDSLLSATADERAIFPNQSLMKKADKFQNLPQPKGPGRNWTIQDLEKMEGQLAGRDKNNGRRMLDACLCSACHVIGNQGGSAGPQLNLLGGRFSLRDLAEAIIAPGNVVSDQYAMQEIIKNDGSTTIAKMLEDKDGKLRLAANAFDLTQVFEIQRSEVKEIRDSPVSPMPPALINRLNEEELKDLLAFLLEKE
jgi:putative heme-binding domain-containing protein